jgi:hypothetical protein
MRVVVVACRVSGVEWRVASGERAVCRPFRVRLRSSPGVWGPSGKPRSVHGAWHRARPKNNPGGKPRHAAPAAICCVGVGPTTHWHCHLPSKYPIPADLSIAITDPTCLIAGRDGASLGERHEALARRERAKEEWAVARGSSWGALKTPLHSLNACRGQDEEISSRSPSPYLSEVLCIYLLLQNE